LGIAKPLRIHYRHRGHEIVGEVRPIGDRISIAVNHRPPGDFSFHCVAFAEVGAEGTPHWSAQHMHRHRVLGGEAWELAINHAILGLGTTLSPERADRLLEDLMTLRERIRGASGQNGHLL
jgi:hypothetical protein